MKSKRGRVGKLEEVVVGERGGGVAEVGVCGVLWLVK